jgi:hypothetical protein
MAELGSEISPSSPAEFGKLIAEETEKWGQVVKFAGLKGGLDRCGPVIAFSRAPGAVLWWTVAPAPHSATFRAGLDVRPNSAWAVRKFGLAPGLGETAMGETLLLLSCGAAFITGIVIAATSLFGG